MTFLHAFYSSIDSALQTFSDANKLEIAGDSYVALIGSLTDGSGMSVEKSWKIVKKAILFALCMLDISNAIDLPDEMNICSRLQSTCARMCLILFVKAKRVVWTRFFETIMWDFKHENES